MFQIFRIVVYKDAKADKKVGKNGKTETLFVAQGIRWIGHVLSSTSLCNQNQQS